MVGCFSTRMIKLYSLLVHIDGLSELVCAHSSKIVLNYTVKLDVVPRASIYSISQ